MIHLFRVITDRVKALFATAAALELEGEFLARDAERRAELLRLAARFEAEGLRTVAERLRRQAEAASIESPAASELPTLAHLRGEGLPTDTGPAMHTTALPEPRTQGKRLPLSSNGRKRGH
ncbi:MAG: hypothetical protein U0840_28635 [Gemmataceae bacterium]